MVEAPAQGGAGGGGRGELGAVAGHGDRGATERRHHDLRDQETHGIGVDLAIELHARLVDALAVAQLHLALRLEAPQPAVDEFRRLAAVGHREGGDWPGEERGREHRRAALAGRRPLAAAHALDGLDERQQRLAVEAEGAVAGPVVGVGALHHVLEHQALRREVEAAQRGRHGLERLLQARELGRVEQVRLPLERCQGALDGEVADGDADQVADEDPAVLHVEGEADGGLDVGDEALAVARLGRTGGVERQHAPRGARGGEVRQQDAEHRELPRVVAGGDHLAHLPHAVRADERLVLRVEFAGDGEPGHRAPGCVAEDGERLRAGVEPRDGVRPLRVAGEGHVLRREGAGGVLLGVGGAEPEREVCPPVVRPGDVVGGSGRGEPRAEPLERVEGDHRRAEVQVGREAGVGEHESGDGEARESEGVAERAVDRRALGDGGRTQVTGGGLGVAEGGGRVRRGAAGGERLAEVRLQLALHVGALAAAQSRQSGDAAAEVGEVVG